MTQPSQVPVSEIIGRYQLFPIDVIWQRSRPLTVDYTRADYIFWDKLRWGLAKGYSLGSLFARRVESIFASWVFGGGLVVRTRSYHQYTDEVLEKFISSILDTGESEGQTDSLLMTLYEDALGLGDQWVIVNADGTLSVPSPDTVNVERSPIDYRKITAVEITTRLQEFEVVDRYTEFYRTITIKRGGGPVEQFTYDNFLGRIPVIHIANERSRNEVFGRSIHQALRPLYDQYDDLLYKQLDAAKLLGNPVLAFTGLEDLNAVVDANKPSETSTYTDKDGNIVDRPQIKIDQQSVLLVGKGGDVKFVGPNVGFSQDTKSSLKSLFLLLLDHTGIPEVLWGNELSAGRSSSETQMTQWRHHIEGKQRNVGGWIVVLCNLYLRARKLVDRRIILDELVVEWPPLLLQDQNALLQRVLFAESRGMLRDHIALGKLRLVENPRREAELAWKEHLERSKELAEVNAPPEAVPATGEGGTSSGDGTPDGRSGNRGSVADE